MERNRIDRKGMLEKYDYKNNKINYSMLSNHPKKILSNMGIRIENIKNKTITDIWAGLSPFSTYLALEGNLKNMNFIDPVYQKETIRRIYLKNIIDINKRIEKKISKILELQNQAEMHENESIIRQINVWVENMKINRALISLWKWWIPSELQHVMTMFTNTKEIEDNSQDIVIMQYLLNNITNSEIFDMLCEEANRIVANNWYIWVM